MTKEIYKVIIENFLYEIDYFDFYLRSPNEFSELFLSLRISCLESHELMTIEYSVSQHYEFIKKWKI